jgi:long-chain acyl-CoA synthetase
VQIEFQKRFGVAVPNLYGLSETGPTHYDDPSRPGWQPGSIGRPLDVNEADIVDANDAPVSPHQVGEIVIKGDNVFVGYYENDEIYARVMRGGYFHTGDLGYVDEQGVFYFVDRSKDLIIKGGTNIAPGEIDEILLSYPAIKEAVTIGIPDEMFGEEIKSFVVLKDGRQATAEDIVAHCRSFLPPIKVPKAIEITSSLPKTHSGKLLRRELRQQQAAQVES